MKIFPACLGVSLVACYMACNYDDGQCVVRGSDGVTGVGGSIVSPNGAGGFGDTNAEAEPQSTVYGPCYPNSVWHCEGTMSCSRPSDGESATCYFPPETVDEDEDPTDGFIWACEARLHGEKGGSWACTTGTFSCHRGDDGPPN